MTKLTQAARNRIPKSEFAIPSKEEYPIEDKNHAVNAKSRASGAVNAGRMSKSTEAKIDAKANKVLNSGKSGKK